MKNDVINSISDRHNLPKNRRFELYDEVSGTLVSLDQLDDSTFLDNRHFTLFLLNELETIDEENEDISTSSNDATIAKDKVSSNRYSCYFDKCRKTYKSWI